MKSAAIASLVISAVASLAATSAHAVPVQVNATPLSLAAGAGATFTTGDLSGASQQQVNFESLTPSNAVEISFSWNAGITLANTNPYVLYSSSGPATWTQGTVVPVTFTGTGRSRSSGTILAPFGYYSLVFDVASATGTGQKINGNIDAMDVPAPAALGLLGIGLLGMGLTRRRNGTTATVAA